MGEPLKAVWQGVFKIGSTELECFVLEDGQRIISADSLEKFFNSGISLDEKEVGEDMAKMAKWMREKTIPTTEKE